MRKCAMKEAFRLTISPEPFSDASSSSSNLKLRGTTTGGAAILSNPAEVKREKRLWSWLDSLLSY